MARSRPGVDRIERMRLRAEHAQAIIELSRHLAQCYTCVRAGADVYGRCGTWWRLAKTEHRTRRALRKWEEPETQHMQPLFTEAECDPPPF
jgi:hypothetical protein